MTHPTVSVIVPYYNHGRHLHQTVFAALRATTAPMEIIVVDDGANEPKAETYLNLVKALSPSVKVLRKANGGLSSARNAGLAVAQGEYIQFLDSDDLLTPGKIDLQIAQFRTQPKFDISVTNYLLCDEEGTLFRRDGDPISRFDFTLQDFLYRWERGFSIPIHCALFRKRALEGIAFETSVVGKEDWIFWCRQAHKRRRFGYVPVYGAIYRQHGDGMSKSFAVMGESWLRASEVIDGFVGAAEPRFKSASAEWFNTFYAQQISNQERATPAHAPRIDVQTSEEVSAASTDWIGELARARTQSSAPPFISIVIPVYNHSRYLRECLSSAAVQMARGPVEIVIIDDSSSDPRVRPLLQAFACQTPGVTLLLNDSNLGIAESQNRAVEAARGEYVAWLDCDDALRSDALARVAQALEPGVDYLFTDRDDIDEAGAVLRVARYGGYPDIKPGGAIALDLVDGMVASHLKVMRRAAYLELGGSDPDFTGVQDWDLALKFAAAGKRFAYLPEALYRHRIHTHSVTRGDSVRQFWLTNRVRRRHLQQIAPRTIGEDAARKAALEACRFVAEGRKSTNPDVLIVEEFAARATIRQLKQAWTQGRPCVYVAKPGTPVQDLNLVREFNSYFDAVLALDEPIACFYVGYMWDHSALVLAHDIILGPLRSQS